MATLYTHAIVGLGIAHVLRPSRAMPWPYWGAAILLPTLPDLDVFSTAAYGSTLGHRGITHTLLFAMTLGAIAAATTAKKLKARWWLLASVFVLILVSHGLLDAMTIGGKGIPFFWPFGQRYGNWGPLVAATIAFDTPNFWQDVVMQRELFWVWLPLALVAATAAAFRFRFGGRRPERSICANAELRKH